MKYNFTVLISHELYGSCYPNAKGELTKDRGEAVLYNTIEQADSEAKKLEIKHNCPCYWQSVQIDEIKS
jgi:hypothetical protein